jgi:hypothetical protein
MRFMRKGAAIVLCLLLFGSAAAAEEETGGGIFPDRRKEQFQTEQGYYIFPSPYSIPGVGYGGALIGIGMNLDQTYTDVFGFLLAGDISGGGAGVTDIHIVPRTLILDLTAIRFNKSTVTNYSQRGMETEKHDFTYMQFNNYQFGGGRLTATFLDRRFEVYGGGYRLTAELGKILDEQGNTILDVTNPAPWRTTVYGIGSRLDLTDDYGDPRRGVRFDVGRWWSPPATDSDPDYYRMEYNATAYLPLGKRSTWVFNAFRSDAHVVRQGETDPAVIEQNQGLDCASLTDPDQRSRCNQVIDNILAANLYGNATGLGGTSHLRSYPDNRFSGAHSLFYGTEVRWTLTEEAHPFDIFVAKDVRTVLQVAAFYELGTAADLRSELGDIYRASYGGGFRMVTASGVVLRADLAFGREGMETTIILGYPWESF